MRSRPRAVGALLALLAALGAWPAGATTATTSCAFGGPAGTFRVMRFDLPAGSDFLNLELSSTRATRPTADAKSWHLGQGVFVINEATRAIVSYKISSEGSAPRRAVVAGDGSDPMVADTPGPDEPFIHSDLVVAPGLAPGRYLVAAFGSDGSTDAPNDQWSGQVQLAGSLPCVPIGAGELLDVNHTDFRGGQQVSAYGATVVEGASLSRTINRGLVVGFMDSSTQVAGDATLAYEMPGGRKGEVDDDIVPFVSSRGPHSWTATVHGVAPIVSVVALQVDLP